MAANHIFTAFLYLAVLTPGMGRTLMSRDSLQGKQYSYLFSKINATKSKPLTQQIYLAAFLGKAKEEKDWELIMTGYKNYADHADAEHSIIYCDSMLYVARHAEDDRLIGSAYLSKGIAFYALKKHSQALENYFLAQPFIQKSHDPYLDYKLKYNIAHVKYYLGRNREAINLFSSCLDYFKVNNNHAYLNTLHALGLCHTKAGNYRQSEQLVEIGLKESDRNKNHTMSIYFQHLKGQNDFFARNYELAIKRLTSTIATITENGDFANVAVANFYIGKSYWLMGKRRESLPFLEKVAGTFEKNQYIRADLREDFELLIDYYKSTDDPHMILYYVDRLLKADSLLLETHDNLYDNLHRNYDTKELLLEKRQIEKQLSQEVSGKRIIAYSASLLFCISSVVLLVYEKNRRRQNRIYKDLMTERKKEVIIPAKNVAKDLEIAPETLDKILRLLERWEVSRRFLEPDITQTTLAVYLETNVRYVSSIVLNYRGKKFNDYINDLKVDYIVELLKNDKFKRMYTHEALAKEAGFSTTQRFVQAFKARTDLSPNFFSEKIRKEMAEVNS